MLTAIVRAARIALLVAIGCGAGCATRIESPRLPYAVADAAENAAAPDSDTFRVLDQWSWPDTLDGTGRIPDARHALAEGRLGLYPAQHFRLVDGRCQDCATSAAALWHFRGEIVAVPGPGVRPIDTDSPVGGDPTLHPTLVWLGAPELLDGARLAADGRTVSVDGSDWPLMLPPRNPLDRSHVDAATARFFSRRPLRLRGASVDMDGRSAFVARTLWPLDSRIDRESVTLAPLAEGELLSTLINAQVVAAPGAFPVRLLYERARDAGASWAGKSVIAIVLSGAQGDDQGSHAGHLGVATGHVGPEGEWSDWLVENFYPHRVGTVKAIVSASVPMDNYLLDLTSGQLLFRPGYMLVAVLRRADAAHEIQNALHRSMLDYYCRRFEFDRASRNSTSMSIDPLRALGWRIPAAGPNSRVAGVLGAPLAAAVQLSLSGGREFFDAMRAETTRLLPRVAFEVMGHDLLYLAQAGAREAGLTRFEQMLADDVEAVLFVRLPQIPSSRPYGSYPVRSLLQYGAQVLSDPVDYPGSPDSEALELPERLQRQCDPAGAGSG